MDILGLVTTRKKSKSPTPKSSTRIKKPSPPRKRAGWPTSVVAFTDGASRGNPGPASIGVIVKDEEGNVLLELGHGLGVQTNNYAEYMAVLKAFEVAESHGVTKITVCSDSELMVRQMKGIYQVKSESIRPLFQACQQKISSFSMVEIEHVRREQNREADRLANLALDQGDVYRLTESK